MKWPVDKIVNKLCGGFCLFIFLPSLAFANRYDWRINEYGYSGGDNPIGTLIAFILVIGYSYWFIQNSLAQRKKRHEEGRKVERDSIDTDVVLPFIGYAISAFAVSVPFLLLISFIVGSSAVREYWLFVVGICFCWIVYLRQT